MTSEAFGAPQIEQRLVIWADASQDGLIREMMAELSRPAMLASPREADVVRLAESLNLPATDDLRRDLIEHGGWALMLMASESVSPHVIEVARDRGVALFSLQPRMGLQEDMTRVPRFVPRFMECPAVQAAGDALAEFGPRESVQVMFRARASMGPLASRLFDAMEVVDHVLDGWVQVDATQPTQGGRRRADSLADLDGHLAATVRFDGPAAASVVVSNRAPDWRREVTILGPQGLLRLTDNSYAWIDPSGETVEQFEAPPATPGQLLGLAIRSGVDEAVEPAELPRALRVLSLCEAARLSVRTGQGESPQKLQRILSLV